MGPVVCNEAGRLRRSHGVQPARQSILQLAVPGSSHRPLVRETDPNLCNRLSIQVAARIADQILNQIRYETVALASRARTQTIPYLRLSGPTPSRTDPQKGDLPHIWPRQISHTGSVAQQARKHHSKNEAADPVRPLAYVFFLPCVLSDIRNSFGTYAMLINLAICRKKTILSVLNQDSAYFYTRPPRD